MSSTKSSKIVTIEKRGHFDDDLFFKDSWGEWENAVKDALDRYEKKGHRVSNYSQATSTLPIREREHVYREMRSSNVKSDDSQAVSCTEEDTKYKMVMDVQDFNPENMNVKCVDDTIVVDGFIEKREGNSISTQKFVRKFLLPQGVNMSGISSALSRDGILTISAPKMAQYVTRGDKYAPGSRITTTHTSVTPTGRNVQITRNYPAGKPSSDGYGSFSPTGGSLITRTKYEPRYTETVKIDVPDRRKNTIWTTTDDNKWTSFDTMVEDSHREIEKMMKNHSIDTTDRSTYYKPTSTSLMRAPLNASTTKDITRVGNSVTEREKKQWEDRPAPGLNRTNKMLYENTEIKDTKGNVIGNAKREEMLSNAQGEREEVLPDGTKRKVFTKSYETRNSYKTSSNPKAV